MTRFQRPRARINILGLVLPHDPFAENRPSDTKIVSSFFFPVEASRASHQTVPGRGDRDCLQLAEDSPEELDPGDIRWRQERWQRWYDQHVYGDFEVDSEGEDEESENDIDWPEEGQGDVSEGF